MVRTHKLSSHCKESKMLANDLESIAQTFPSVDIDSEARFNESWIVLANSISDPWLLGIAGGMLSPRFGWVFSAGYQAALRRLFPVDFAGWGAFAVSEDRAPENALPGVTYEGEGDTSLLNGYKTWIAGSDHVTDLIVSARGSSGGDTHYFHVPVDQEGVAITTRPPGRVLPDLSQGQAQLIDARATEIDSSQVADFRLGEVFYIYLAFLGATWQHFPARKAQVEKVLDLSRSVVELKLNHSFKALDAQVQHLLQSMRSEEGERHDLWRRDYKLIAMYAQGDK